MARIMVIGNFPESIAHFRGRLMEEMVRLGHEVIACSPPASEEVRLELDALGVGFEPVPLSRAGMNPFQDLRSLKAFIQLFLKIKPDYVFSYTIKPIVYGAIGASIAGVPHIYSMITGLGYSFSEGGGKRALVNRLARILYRIGLRNNRTVFFQNPDDQVLFETLGLVKTPTSSVLINGSGVDLNDYAVAPLPKKISFLLIARLIREKGIREFCQAACIIKEKYPDTIFRLVGMLDTNPESIRQQEIDAWTREGAVEYLGFLPDVRPVMVDTSVYVLPSYYREGIPRSTLEALAMGRPIITTDSPGCRETVIDRLNGFLVPVQDSDAVATAMEQFIREPELIPKMGGESRKLAEERFDVRKVNRAILQGMGLWKEGDHVSIHQAQRPATYPS